MKNLTPYYKCWSLKCNTHQWFKDRIEAEIHYLNNGGDPDDMWVVEGVPGMEILYPKDMPR